MGWPWWVRLGELVLVGGSCWSRLVLVGWHGWAGSGGFVVVGWSWLALVGPGGLVVVGGGLGWFW